MYPAPHLRRLVADFPACFHFYQNVLGLTPRFVSEGDVYADFEIDDGLLALYRRELMADAVGSASKPVQADAQDRAMLVLTTESVDDAVVRLQTAGIAPTVPAQDRPEWGVRSAHFRDPDGNLIEINAPLPG